MKNIIKKLFTFLLKPIKNYINFLFNEKYHYLLRLFSLLLLIIIPFEIFYTIEDIFKTTKENITKNSLIKEQKRIDNMLSILIKNNKLDTSFIILKNIKESEMSVYQNNIYYDLKIYYKFKTMNKDSLNAYIKNQIKNEISYTATLKYINEECYNNMMKKLYVNPFAAITQVMKDTVTKIIRNNIADNNKEYFDFANYCLKIHLKEIKEEKIRKEKEYMDQFVNKRAYKLYKKLNGEATIDQCNNAAKGYIIGPGNPISLLEAVQGRPDDINYSNYGDGIKKQYVYHNYNPSCYYDDNNDGIIDSYN